MGRSWPFAVCVALAVGAFAPSACASGPDYSAPGPYEAGRRVVTVTRADGSSFTAEVVYPAVSRGDNAPMAPGGAWPSVSFGHGFVTPVSQYRGTLEHLASWGFLAIASTSEGGFFPSHARFASDLSRCLTWLEDRHADPGSFLFGRVDVGAFAVSGHSMGGGASILSAASDGRVRAVVPLAPAETNPSAVGASAGLSAPVLMICGDADAIVPTGTNGARMYGATPRARRLASLAGGFHCGFIDGGMIGCDASGGMTRADQLRLTRGLMTAWLTVYLTDEGAGAMAWLGVWGPGGAGDPRVSVQRDARAEVTTAEGEVEGTWGRGVELSGEVLNTGPVASGYEVVVQAGGVVVGSAVVGPVAPGGAAPWVLRAGSDGVTWAGNPTAAGVVVSARSLADGGTRAWAGVMVSWFCPADVNRDGFIDFFDVDVFVSCFEGEGCGEGVVADFNGDGFVDFFDLDAFAGAFGAGC
ncbi:MAG: dienelactone hydrolase family protein [Phycisphaeraceae bacterium]|nr:MAG: dienelactone hydrolase family protein [Phycisphaeraceae bacterium]